MRVSSASGSGSCSESAEYSVGLEDLFAVESDGVRRKWMRRCPMFGLSNRDIGAPGGRGG